MWVRENWGADVLTFAAMLLFIGGLLLMKTWPITGFLVMVCGIALGGKAVRTPDDMEWFAGLCLLCGAIYSTYLFAVKLL